MSEAASFRRGDSLAMKSLGFVVGAVLVCAGALSAQEESTPRFEAGVTYSGVHLNAPDNNGQRTGNGGSGSFEYNINRYLGVVADIGVTRIRKPE
jgi:hypothetical protein